ncbi:LysR family transcriptional regulator, partial [Pseudomonas syringae pv. theae]
MRRTRICSYYRTLLTSSTDKWPEIFRMNRNDLRRVDLNLLIVFETLMHERSVTRAAEKLFLGQPAISAALSRLRGLFDD